MERHLPAHAGAILADLKITMHSAGFQMANVGFFVLSAAHLYKAFHAKGLLQGDWHDMDFVIASFGTKKPLVAKTTMTMDSTALCRHYLMALGVPATEFARNKRAGSSKTFNVNLARQLTVTSPFLQAMNDRRWNNEQLGSQISKRKTVEVALQIMASSTDKSPSGKKRGNVGSHLRDRYTPLQLLAAFKASLLADEAQLNFNYISFTVSCMRLVESISDLAGLQLGLQALDVLHADTQVVSDLLKATSSDPAVCVAVKLMQDHIATSGKRFVKEAFDQSSGRIPKHLRPVIKPSTLGREGTSEIAEIIFDHAGVKYLFSGGTFAAYHPGIQPECGRLGCLNHQHDSRMMSDAAVRLSRVTVHGSPIPDAILELSLASIEKNADEYLAARDRMLTAFFMRYAQGNREVHDEDMLRSAVASWTGLELEPLDDAPDGSIPWAYVIKPDHDKYATLCKGCVQSGSVLENGAALLWPGDLGVAQVAAVRQNGLSYLH